MLKPRNLNAMGRGSFQRSLHKRVYWEVMNPFSSPQPLEAVRAAQKRGLASGIYAVCSAHPAVLEAAMRTALAREDSTLLIEATCNQVNQFGGYTGLTPAGFAAFVARLADEVGLPCRRILLGGDHLGPNPWRGEAPEQALAKAAGMAQDYVRAGFNKIHLDASMSCAGEGPLRPEEIAARAARLCAAVEQVRGESAPLYVIGTEVPPPGGARGAEAGPVPTPAREALETVEIFEQAFRALGLEAAWERAVALVVQPGVEFGHAEVHDYQPERAAGLVRAIESLPGQIFEAHSSDYQTRAALRQLVRDHFAILKVGPGLTFAYREALFALAALERELPILDGPPSGLVETAEAEMLAHPRDWQDYYHGSPAEQAYARKYSLSDRIRYYWARPALEAAVARLLDNLERHPAPLGLLSQYLPGELARVRGGSLPNRPRDLIRAHIQTVLADYDFACAGGQE